MSDEMTDEEVKAETMKDIDALAQAVEAFESMTQVGRNAAIVYLTSRYQRS